MTVISGIGIGRSSVVGPVVRVASPAPVTTDASRGSSEEERAAALAALEGVASDLRRKATAQTGIAADILTAQALMAEDPDLAEEVIAQTAEGASASEAITGAFEVFRSLLMAAGSHFGERVADIDDVCRRAVAFATGADVGVLPTLTAPAVLVATDLAPADTAELDPEMVLAFVTEEGGPTSHTAILARARGIPAIVGCAGAATLADGDLVLVDAMSGDVVRSPSEAQVAQVGRRRTARTRATGPGRTADGVPVALMANVGSTADVEAACLAGAEGVGLLRTEFLFLHRQEAPGLEEQTSRYTEILRLMPQRRVVARVLDAGADKPMQFLSSGAEPNPALGVRGLRALRGHLEVLDIQLEALARASAAAEADVWVMAPMVADAEEARWFVERSRALGLRTCGVMIEIPAAVLTADQILDVVDFVSLGTNDLAQYALAADRMLGAVGAFLDPWHPAVLRLVQMTAEAAGRKGKPLSVCGEAAADPLLACALVGVGVTSLSMSPGALEDVRTSLAETPMADCRLIAETILATGTAAEARTAVAQLPTSGLMTALAHDG